MSTTIEIISEQLLLSSLSDFLEKDALRHFSLLVSVDNISTFQLIKNFQPDMDLGICESRLDVCLTLTSLTLSCRTKWRLYLK